MKKSILLLLGLCILKAGFAQQFAAIIPASSTVKSYHPSTGGQGDTTQAITIKVVFWYSSAFVENDFPVAFALAPIGATPALAARLNIAGNLQIAKAKFKRTFDTASFDIPFTINGSSILNAPAFYAITLNGGTPANVQHTVTIAETIAAKPVASKDSTMRGNIMFLNAANFDFGPMGGTNYLGHLNFYAPDIKEFSAITLGINAGAMKINYASAGDSLSRTYYTTEKVLLKPLDHVVTGLKYLTQFNKYALVSKNSSWSFYAQPMIGFKFNGENARLYFHVHFELLVNKWTTTGNVQNIQQDTSFITTATPTRNDYGAINHFEKNTTDAYPVSNTETYVSEYIGFGGTFDVRPWQGGKLFIQPTFGAIINYGLPSSLNPVSLRTTFSKSNNFYLTRLYIQQELTSALQAVVGINLRGTFTSAPPVYATYIGLNVGLNGIKSFFK